MCRRTCSCPTKDPDIIRVRSPPPEQPSPPDFRSVDQLERTSIPALDRRVRGRAVPKPVSWQEENIPCSRRDSRRLGFSFCCKGMPRSRSVDARLKRYPLPICLRFSPQDNKALQGDREILRQSYIHLIFS